MGIATSISTYGIPLSPVSSFKYLGIVLLVEDNNWMSEVRNLRRARDNWLRLTRVLGREGSYSRTLGMFYVAVVQVVLLHGSETSMNWEYFGRLPPQGVPQTDGKETAEGTIW